MTINDLRCDRCGRYLLIPADGVRFVHHPGIPELRDDSGLACADCWEAMPGRPQTAGPQSACAKCGTPVTRRTSLHVRRFDDPHSWRLCATHTVEFLNALRTVTPKLDPATFRFPAG